MKDWHAFLLHFESTLDTEVGPRVSVYDLEAIQKKKDETAKELVACIYQMAARACIGNGSTAAIEFEVQCRFIKAITDDKIELRQRLLAAPLTVTTSELLTIAEGYYAVEHRAQQMCSGGTKSVMLSIEEHPTGKDNPNKHKGNHRMVQTVVTTKNKNLDVLIAQLMSLYATNVDTLDTGKQNAEEVSLLTGSPTSPNPPGSTDNKGRKVGLTLLILMNMTANMMRSTCTQSMKILMRLRWMTW